MPCTHLIFAPLSAGSSTAAMNATWGQKSADVAVESATEATAEIEASA